MFNVKHSTRLLVAGSIALDTLEGDYGVAPDELGGSALYFALAASLIMPVSLVAVVGRDDAEQVQAAVAGRPIDLEYLDVLDAPTFRWRARHEAGGNVDLGRDDRIYDLWQPRTPNAYGGWAFAGSMRPSLQLAFLEQVRGAALLASDAMLSYVRSAPADAARVIGASTWFFANAAELTALGGDPNAADAFRAAHGLEGLVVKSGPGGAGLVTGDDDVLVPALLSHPVVDTTGAGDAVAAGFLARRLTAPGATYRDALEHGIGCASITIEDIGLRALLRATPDVLAERVLEVRGG